MSHPMTEEQLCYLEGAWLVGNDNKIFLVEAVAEIRELRADNAQLRAALDELINCPALADARALLAQKKAEPAGVA